MINKLDYFSFPGAAAIAEALEARDAYTRFHCDRVVYLATELGAACGLSEADLNVLRVGACFHDLGKIGIPDSVLLKPGKLTSDDWVFMRQHPEIGERIFAATGLTAASNVGLIIRHHHESCDGSGYPDGLEKQDIPRLSRILRVVDSYDAMTSVRPYQHARSHHQAMEILRTETGTRLDPDIMVKFEAVIKHSEKRAL